MNNNENSILKEPDFDLLTQEGQEAYVSAREEMERKITNPDGSINVAELNKYMRAFREKEQKEVSDEETSLKM